MEIKKIGFNIQDPIDIQEDVYRIFLKNEVGGIHRSTDDKEGVITKEFTRE